MSRAFGGYRLFPLFLLLQFFHPNDPNPLEHNNKVVGEYTYNIMITQAQDSTSRKFILKMLST